MDITNLYKIKVRVTTAYLENDSDPSMPLFLHSYRVSIKNNGPHTVKLLTRHWRIFDFGSELKIVDGEGVVGQQPIIEPGGTYSYQSFCKIKSAFGKMEGHYTFEEFSGGEKFKVAIPTFVFEYPVALN